MSSLAKNSPDNTETGDSINNMTEYSNQGEKEESLYLEDDDIPLAPSKLKSFLSSIKEFRIEVVMFLYMFSFSMRLVSNTTLIMDKVCLVQLNFSVEECSHLALHPYEKDQVEKLANYYIVGHSMIQMLPACVIAAFVGAWSDKYGRKFPLIVAQVGILLDGIGVTVCAAFVESDVAYVLLSAAFMGLSGGIISVLTIIYSYTSDITTVRQRTLKYAIMEAASGLSAPLGQLAGGWVYDIWGYVPVLLTSASGHLLSLLWVIFVLSETKGLDNTDTFSVKLRSLFSLSPLIEGVKATVQKRPNRGREKMLFLILGLTVITFSYSSSANINYLYVHHQYDWGNTEYSTVASTFSLIGVFFMMVAVPLFKHFNLGDATLGVVGCVSFLAKDIVIGLAFHPRLYYVAQALGLLSSLATLAGRSSISKVVSKDDLGKVFSFITTSESLLHVIVAAVVSQLFNLTLDVYPGIVFIGAGALLLIPIAVFIWLGRQSTISYEDMDNIPQNAEGLT